MKKFIAIIIFTLSFAASSYAQSKTTLRMPSELQVLKNTPAYAEVLLKKVSLEAEIEDLLVTYTDEFPKVKQLRFRLDLTNKALEKILSVQVQDAAKLSEALGKMIVQKIEYEAELAELRKEYSDEYAEVKRAKRKVEVYEKAIREILP